MPSSTPTVGIEAGLNRSAIQARMSHPMPVSRNIHQGPARRASPARALDWMSVRSSMVLMSSFLSGRWLPGYGDRLPDDLPGSGDMKPGREQASREVASTFVDSE